MTLPCAVGEHLHLDVARRRDVFLDQHARVAERRFPLARRAFERGIELGVLVDAAHAFAAAACHGLDQHRIADLVGLLLQEFRVLLLAVIARHHRHAGLLHQRLGLILQSHRADRVRRRTDEHDARSRAGFGKLRVLGEEAVARMDALRAGTQRHLDQLLDDQIALARGRRADQMRLVGDARVQRACVGLGVDRDHAQAEPLCGARDANGDLAAVGNQDG